MTNQAIINQLNYIETCFYNEKDINKSNNGFNLLKDLKEKLKEEELLKDYKPSEKERIKLALELQKKGFKSNRPILGLFHIREDKKQIFISNDTSWLVALKEKDYISGVKTTDDTFTYEDKRTCFKWDASSKVNYPNTLKIGLSGAVEEIITYSKQLLNFLKVNKKEDIILSFKGIKALFHADNMLNALILSNAINEEVLKIKYKDNLHMFIFNDTAIVMPYRQVNNERSYPTYTALFEECK